MIFKMKVYYKRIKFVAVLLMGMISLLLIYDNLGYNNIHRYISNKTLQNSLVVNSFDESPQKSKQIYTFVSNVKSFKNQSNIGLLSAQDYLINRSVNNEEIDLKNEHKLLLAKVIGFESKYLKPMKKWSKDSKLLYSDQIKPITEMTIGDNNCDNNYGSALKVVIIVISRVNGFTRRQTLRQTWAQRIQESKEVRLYFAIGLSSDTNIQKQIVLENNEFNDLLQWNFVDNYYNLTIKSLAILRWFSLNCFRTQFLYKIDDDCIVNKDSLLNFTAIAMQNTIYGHLWKNAFVERKKNSKFFISRTDYKFNSYPDYTGGPWLMSGKVVPLLYQTAITESLPALPYEDVYITGIVANRTHIKRKQLSGLVYFSKSMYKKLNKCWFDQNIIFWQNLNDLWIKKIWKNIENTRHLNCVHSTVRPLKTIPI